MKTESKLKLFKTARALIGCARFNAGDIVAISYYAQGPSGTHYFRAGKTREDVLNDLRIAAYPEHHLTDFVL